MGCRFESGSEHQSINTVMQLKIYINDKLYKTVTVETETYDPNDFWPQIKADKEAGLLNSFDIAERMKIEFRKVQ